MSNYFLDLETDGLPCELGGTFKPQILQIALVDEDLRVVWSEFFGCDYRSDGAYGISGYDVGLWGNLPKWSDKSRDKFFSFLLNDHNTIWAHNSAFEAAVLGAPPSLISCTMKLACEKLGKPGQTRFKLPILTLEPRPHDATSDAINCALLWHKCMETGPFDPQKKFKLL